MRRRRINLRKHKRHSRKLVKRCHLRIRNVMRRFLYKRLKVTRIQIAERRRKRIERRKAKHAKWVARLAERRKRRIARMFEIRKKRKERKLLRKKRYLACMKRKRLTVAQRREIRKRRRARLFALKQKRILARRERRQKRRIARHARHAAKRTKRVAFLKRLRSLRNGHLFSKRQLCIIRRLKFRCLSLKYRLYRQSKSKWLKRCRRALRRTRFRVHPHKYAQVYHTANKIALKRRGHFRKVSCKFARRRLHNLLLKRKALKRRLRAIRKQQRKRINVIRRIMRKKKTFKKT